MESPWLGCLTTAAVDAVSSGEQSPDHVMVAGFTSCGLLLMTPQLWQLS